MFERIFHRRSFFIDGRRRDEGEFMTRYSVSTGKFFKATLLTGLLWLTSATPAQPMSSDALQTSGIVSRPMTTIGKAFNNGSDLFPNRLGQLQDEINLNLSSLAFRLFECPRKILRYAYALNARLKWKQTKRSLNAEGL